MISVTDQTQKWGLFRIRTEFPLSIQFTTFRSARLYMSARSGCGNTGIKNMPTKERQYLILVIVIPIAILGKLFHVNAVCRHTRIRPVGIRARLTACRACTGNNRLVPTIKPSCPSAFRLIETFTSGYLFPFVICYCGLPSLFLRSHSIFFRTAILILLALARFSLFLCCRSLSLGGLMPADSSARGHGPRNALIATTSRSSKSERWG